MSEFVAWRSAKTAARSASHEACLFVWCQVWYSVRITIVTLEQHVRIDSAIYIL